jgi:hypothetical protein
MKIIERVAEHYDTQEVEFGRTYIWCPESVVLECSKCATKMTLTKSELIHTQPECECGKGRTARAREEVVIQLVDEEYEAHHHPWHYDLQVRPTNTYETKLLTLRAPPGAITTLRLA